jgi:hypothetical protein
MRSSFRTTLVLGALLTTAACKKGDDKQETAKAGEGEGKSGDPAKKGDPAKTGDPTADTPADPGVEAGGIEREADEGPAAVMTEVKGAVEVRRVGEAEFAEVKGETSLYPGDQVRTGEEASATVTMADESVVEVAEVSTVAVGSRDGSADPASSAAVLTGIARFTVSDRAPGEGAFRVYTSAGVVMTTGTVYAVGVAASGAARIGVESGSVEVVGLADIAAAPVVVEAEQSAAIVAEGTVEPAVEWKADDWGQWRAEADAAVAVDVAVDAHANAMAEMSAELDRAYADLEAQAEAYAAFEEQAAVSAEADAVADYEAAAPEGVATIEASFGLAGHIEALTWAHAARAELASEIYARHQTEVEAQCVVAAPHVDAAVLWPKRFEVTSAAYLEPLRVQYYVHHPRGRVHAELVGVAVPAFYVKAKVPEPEPEQVRARVRVGIWAQPVVRVKAQARPVWIAAPRANWRAKVKVRPARYRAQAGFYVRPASFKTTVLVGGAVKVKVVPKVVVKAKEPRAKIRAHFKGKVAGGRIKIKAPDLDAAAKARMKVKVKGGVVVRDHREQVDVPEAGGEVRGKVDVKVKGKADVDVKVKEKVGGGVKVKVKDHRDKAGEAAGKAKVKVKVKKPEVKGKVDVKVKAKGGVKIGK